jgi:hypothetical protein
LCSTNQLRLSSTRLSDRISVAFRQRPQLLQREPAAAARRRDENACPYPLRAWCLTRILGALPPAWALTAQSLGALIGDRRPSVRIPCANNCRGSRRLHSLRPFFRPRQYARIVGTLRTYCRSQRIRGHITQVYE